MSEPRNAVENHHPGVMIEIIAKDQQAMKTFYSKVFGWRYHQSGTNGFAYVHFGERKLPLLAGIGQCVRNTPGFEPGHYFYLLVDDLEATIEAAVQAGGKEFVPPTEADGYHFAMIRDPEGNPIGLIAPFTD
jgi:predicted enzyme related to lactoylglutathione lyase